MNIETTAQTLESIVEPIIALLNEKYPTGDLEEYQILLFDRFGVLDSGDDPVVIELPDDLTNNDLALRAVATLLRATGSEIVWGRGTPSEDPGKGPLRFSLRKDAAWAGHFWMWSRYIIVNHGRDEFDAEAAAKQVALLVEYLQEPANLVELGTEERAIF